MSSDADLQRIVDEQAIIDVAIRYCWALDTRNWGELHTVFVDDATATLGEARDLVGIDAIAARCREALEPLDASQHMVSTHQVAIDGDVATHRCYIHAQHHRRGLREGKNYVVGGRYEDRLVRTPEGWRIAERTLTVMWTDGNRRVLVA